MEDGVFSTTAPEAAAGDDTGERTVTECVDVYLLAPEEDREIELKDFTIMKPKNNKMHRLVRYYPRCEISYRAVPPPTPEEKVVTSPNGTKTTTVTTTTHRHNGGFSNPSRNTEVFRMKRKLLNEYYTSIKKDPSFLAMDTDALAARAGYTRNHNHNHTAIRATYRRPASPPGWDDEPPTRASLARFPRYQRMPVGDEETIPVTSAFRHKHIPFKARAHYISSLWPEIAPVDDDEEIMDYYGLEVQIISEEERKKERMEAALGTTTTTTTTIEEPPPSQPAPSPVKTEPVEQPTSGNLQSTEEDDESGPEMTVETRSAAKMKDAEPTISPVATKQDDWVQCDKCSKWRRLPNHVNVSELPATWYCKMNRWDKRFNKCSVPEEKVVVPMKEADLVEYRERKFVQDFMQRVKRMEKAMAQYKFTDARDDNGERHVVQCIECFKQRPLLGGMDPHKITQPFVCWMSSWDEVHASCSAPQGAIPSRHFELLNGPSSSTAGGEETGSTGSKKSGSSTATSTVPAAKSGGGSGGGNTASAKKPPTKPANTTGTSNATSTSTSSAKATVKRRPSEASTDKEGKKTKRR